MDRRCFIKKSAVTGLAVGISLYTGSPEIVFSDENKNGHPDLVALKNGEPGVMFKKGIEAMGGMKRFVKKGQTVLVKPNIGFNKTPEFAANTNPQLVKSIVEHCFGAGAKKVYVFDHEARSSYGLAAKCYKNSGIQDAASSAGAIVAPGHDEKYYQEVKVPKANALNTTKVHELVLETDVLINVPILKSHGYTFLTSAMKNLMGVVWDRMVYHYSGLDQCIADFCLFKKPALNVVDAYRVMKTNGPQGNSLEDVVIAKNLLISDDIVAIDTAASKILGIEPEKVEYISIGRDLKLGNMNLNELNIKRMVL
jgi:uncharacterized protein (DUF362 family)